jgi:GNAT superfamily N-acetyltransferase
VESIILERVTDLPPDIDEIVRLSLDEEFRAIRRLREDWVSGANRFDRPGEAFFEARVGSRLVGVCGLNEDPYATLPEIGRVRHLYVHPEFRRSGIGRRLVSMVVEHACSRFSRVRLRTQGADADRFYLALGFRRVVGEHDATHDLLTPCENVKRV